ncbi:MerR family transcriptional regulator [Stackebrandtia nassauensis]|uniref:Transcriptional regulator, MerR family n=1 Tax=Stackebrandtia nassauensis (strain DSM 44728 / CIP 108903 / NRRL B-16338 / NBRC 102104 / LLR-40K-21) TaxID=446470 RepID=D3Q5U4_STANL|nr:MerR family transcriptional regulator [Stackebrandtia nassauensis]ADD40243.1 transcriptional regulator, MerR family [Stackebrandtia nassauensis DSM 44728]
MTDTVPADIKPDPDMPMPDGSDAYSIAEAARLTGMSAHTLRWYERIGLVTDVHRNHSGERRYRNDDLRWLGFVSRLRQTGMPVAEMVRYAELMRAGEHTSAERRDMLLAHRERLRAQLAELRSFETVLDFKIEHYDTVCREEQ